MKIKKEVLQIGQYLRTQQRNNQKHGVLPYYYIGMWFKLIDHNYEVICGIYNKSMKKLFKQIPTMK